MKPQLPSETDSDSIESSFENSDNDCLSKAKKHYDKRLLVSDKSHRKSDLLTKKLCMRKGVRLPESIKNAKLTSSEEFFKTYDVKESYNDNENSLNEFSDDSVISTNQSPLFKVNQSMEDTASDQSVVEGQCAENVVSTQLSEDSEMDEKLAITDDLFEKQREIEKNSCKKNFIFHRKQEKNIEETKTIGQNVKNQLSVWSFMLTYRIFFQRLLQEAESLPVEIVAQENPIMKSTKLELCKLLIRFRNLQLQLLKKNRNLFNRVKRVSRKGFANNKPIENSLWHQRQEKWKNLNRLSEIESKRRKSWNYISSLLECIVSTSLDVFDEWHSKTVILAKRQFKILDQSPSSQLNRVLQDNYSRILEKSLVQRPPNSSQASVSEMYNDIDFYLHLLQSTVDNNSQFLNHVSTESIAAQKFSKKIKQQDKAAWDRDVERRASKGRKIRYKVIPQLLSFMTHEPQSCNEEAFCDNADSIQRASLVDHMINSLFQ